MKGEVLVIDELPDIAGMDLSEEEFRLATERGAERERTEPRAKRARYDGERDRVVVELRTGIEFAVPRRFFRTLQDATPDEMADMGIMPRGGTLVWHSLDDHYSVPALVEDLFGNQVTAAEMGRQGGKARTPAKAAAARANGRKGGRPRKSMPASAAT